MKLPIPKTWSDKIANCTEAELTLLAILHHMQKRYPEDELTFYKYDLMLIINFERGSSPHTGFINISRLVKAALINDYRMAVHLRYWTPDEVMIDIEHPRNIAIWWHIYNQGGMYQRYIEDEPALKSFRDISLPANRQFVNWLKKSYPIHDPRGKGRVRYLDK